MIGLPYAEESIMFIRFDT